MTVEFRILGPLEVRGKSGPIALGGLKPRAVVAVLLLHANESVHAERLALELWGPEAPPSAVKTVQVYVSRLRKAFGDPEVLATTAAGYRLRVRADELDAEHFGRLLDGGRAALAAGRHEYAAAVLREALGLWRGPPLADLAFEPFAQTEIARLQEQRLAAIEERVEADLALGRHRGLVAELRGLVADNPTRERLVGQLMLALYRDGRHDEALELFRDTRRSRLDELGVEPGRELRELQERILRQDVALHPSARPAPELPSALDASNAPRLDGREGELAWLRLRWERARDRSAAVVAIVGERGAGKTRLAAELAAEVHSRGETVLYVSAKNPAGTAAPALQGIHGPVRPTLLVVDDVDEAAEAFVAQLDEATRELRDAPVLVVVCVEDAAVLAHLCVDGVLTLEPLGPVAVGAIAREYVSERASEEVPSEWLLQASGGIARRVHEVASQWARRDAARRVSTVAAKAQAERSQLRSIHDELTGELADFQYARERILQRPPQTTAVVCPFKGLASYDVADAEYFFGRERLVRELVARLVGARLLGIVGPSGSGKSSVLRAGLLPELASGVLPGSQTWDQRLLRPGEHPLQALATALDGVERAEHVLIAVDQLEEMFTACDDEEERQSFVRELVCAAEDPAARYVVVVALRADFYGRCATYPRLSDLLAANNVLVGPMRRDELRAAIERPAQHAGLRVESELVDALLDDVEGAPSPLPLLSTALLELWQRRDGQRLRYATYERTGGVRGAVARLAEDAYGQLDAVQQAIARGVLMRMTGMSAEGTVERHRVALSELETERDENVARVVALLTDRRLLTISPGSVELAHEALLREWPRLSRWIEEDAAGLRIQRDVAAAAQEWQHLGHDEGTLYRGTRLAQALEWRDNNNPSLNQVERDFLDASAASRDRERTTRRRRLALVFSALTIALIAAIGAATYSRGQRAIAESRELATKSSALLATDPGLALTVALEALERSDTRQAQNAVRQAAFEHRAARVIAAHDDLAYDIALSPNGRAAATASADRTVRIWNLRTGRRIGQIAGYREEVRAVSFSRDGRRLATSSADGEIALAAGAGGPRRELLRLESDFARSVDFGGNTLAIGTDAGRIALVQTRDGRIRYLSAARGPAVYAVDFDSRAQNVISGGEAGARIWNVSSGTALDLAHRLPVIAAAFSPDGSQAATVDVAGRLRLWETRTARRLRSIAVSDQLLVSVRFSADGRRIVIGAFDGVIHVLGAREGAVVAELRGHKGPVHVEVGSGRELRSLGEEDRTLRTWIVPDTLVPLRPGTLPRFSRDGNWVVSGDQGGAVRVWRPATGHDRQFEGHTDVSYAQFSPQAKHIVSASHDGTVRLWDVATGRSRVIPAPASPRGKFAAAIDARGGRIAICGDTPVVVVQAPDGSRRLRLRGHRGRVNTLVFSPDSSQLATASDDATARVWDVRTGALRRTLRGHDGIVRDVSYSNDGRLMSTAGSDGTVRVWPTRGGDAVILVGHEGGVNTAEFDDSGDLIVSAGDDGTVRVWNAAGGDALVVLHRHGGAATGADFGDGHEVVHAGADGMRITRCDVCGSPEQVLRVARTRASHKLTAVERQRVLGDG